MKIQRLVQIHKYKQTDIEERGRYELKLQKWYTTADVNENNTYQS